ncbi:uncharacterized protein LOC143876082 [Tasmannia lanceolata]|uniref:uncharacterized protein LOC143876082 n=1 Tax=Tasmannia lanceolata TaxID=3420 RepID=UPI004062F189
MQISSNVPRLSWVFRVPVSTHFDRFFVPPVERPDDFSTLMPWEQHRFGFPHGDRPDDFPTLMPWQQRRSFSFQALLSSETIHGVRIPSTVSFQHLGHQPICLTMTKACLTSEANKADGGPTEAVKELYLKMLKSVEAETMPPNAWLWSLLENCANREDIKLLFQILQNLRRFRLSNLRIHANFNCQLCLRVAEACARAGALDFGKKTLWKHNIYGLTPSIGSAHYLLLYAKEHNDAKLMVDIMKILKKNQLPLQPGTADIVFSICYKTDNWGLISKYSKKFIQAGVKLRRTTFGIWMEFAAKRGDAQSIWKIEELRLKTVNQHNLATGFSCAKAYLLENKPENAASIIHMLNENMPDRKKPDVTVELQKLVSKWPLEVINQQKKEDRKALGSSLRKDIPAMLGFLSELGLEVLVDMEDLIREEVVSS